MKKLWRRLPPPLADSFGFIEVLRQTDGFGLIDDCSGYRLARDRHTGPNTRTCCSEVDSGDVINGSREKVMKAFRAYFQEGRVSFALLASGPCAAMIGTDLEEIAQTLSAEFKIPVGVAKVTGQKNYDIGLSKTMLALARLLCEKQKVVPGSVNLIGGSRYDWPDGAVCELRRRLEEKGCPVIAALGGPVRAEELRRMPAASGNIVLTVSGLETAKYLEETYGTPYMVLSGCKEIPENEWSSMLFSHGKLDFSAAEHAQSILILSEQLTGNALRSHLRGQKCPAKIAVGTLFTQAREFAQPGDIRLRSEEDVEKCILEGGYDGIIGDPALRVLAPDTIPWMDLPHLAIYQFDEERISQ